MFERKWKIFLIHHSHTDIGYTERQEKIMRYHVDYTRQAIDILNRRNELGLQQSARFVWQCENFWIVKNFYENAGADEIAAFEKYVSSGEIGISANYLNLTELADKAVLSSRIAQARDFGNRIGRRVSSSMSADINGFAWGFADILADNGIENHFSCLHTHHGMFPLYQKQLPFYWEGPSGRRILVWNGEHYNIGLEMFFTPWAGGSYMVQDEFSRMEAAGALYPSDPDRREETELAVCQERVSRYLENLENEGYPYDFVPMMLSGCVTDNAPPNEGIAERAAKITELFGGRLEVEMANLDDFFSHLRANGGDIPVYSGDWSDWWADGVGSTPNTVKLFRDAQRKHSLCRKLDADHRVVSESRMDETAENLILYAEHTWGYSSSVWEPWETLVCELDLKKTCYAVNAHNLASGNLDDILAARGEKTITPMKEQRYTLVNPHPFPVKTTAATYVQFWESMGGLPFMPGSEVEAYDEKTGETLPSQSRVIARGTQVELYAELAPHEERVVRFRRAAGTGIETVSNRRLIGAEGVEDVTGDRANIEKIETDRFILRFKQGHGLVSCIDRRDGAELLDSRAGIAPFAGVYEVTDANGDYMGTRARMGRNRKSPATKRSQSVWTNAAVTEDGPVCTAVRLDYTLEGTRFYRLTLKIYKALPRIDAVVHIHKDVVWDPENLYVALPFTLGREETRWIDKTGCVLRPGIDQLPGSNQSFYLVQNGIVMQSGGKQLTVSLRDTPLVVFGDLQAGPVRLCDRENVELNRGVPYAWVMNNFWETNFKVDLGGFYEFTYSVELSERQGAEEAFSLCAARNEGVLCFYS